jgi:hypothetical protein
MKIAKYRTPLVKKVFVGAILKQCMVIFFILFFIPYGLFAMSAKPHKYDQCPKDKSTRFQLYKTAHNKLISSMGKGESGKLDTAKKQKTAKRYEFYADCMKYFGDTLFDSNTPLSCSAKFDKSKDVLTIDMRVQEKEAYESLKRVEVSIHNAQGKEFFRAMNNRMDHPAPVPPNAFGLYPVGEKEIMTDRDIKDAGHEAAIPVKSQYGYLLDGCKTHWKKGIVTIHWLIVPEHWNCPDGGCTVYVKIVTAQGNDAPWQKCSTFVYPRHQASLKPSKVKPMVCSRKDKNNCFMPKKITLVTLSKQKRQGVLKRWAGDTAYEYEYKETERKVIDMTKKVDHSLTLKPGYYQILYNDVSGEPPSGFYGKSEVFEVKDGGNRCVDVFVQSAL